MDVHTEGIIPVRNYALPKNPPTCLDTLVSLHGKQKERQHYQTLIYSCLHFCHATGSLSPQQSDNCVIKDVTSRLLNHSICIPPPPSPPIYPPIPVLIILADMRTACARLSPTPQNTPLVLRHRSPCSFNAAQTRELSPHPAATVLLLHHTRY